MINLHEALSVSVGSVGWQSAKGAWALLVAWQRKAL